MHPIDTRENFEIDTIDRKQNAIKHCIFRSGAGWFSLPAMAVQEITVMPDLFRVPCCHRALAGVSHFRSDFLPVVCLNSLFPSEATTEVESHDRLLVLRANQSVVSGHYAIRIIEANALESIDAVGGVESRISDSKPSPIQGTSMYRNHVVRVLDPIRLYRLVRDLVEEQWRMLWKMPEFASSEEGLCVFEETRP